MKERSRLFRTFLPSFVFDSSITALQQVLQNPSVMTRLSKWKDTKKLHIEPEVSSTDLPCDQCTTGCGGNFAVYEWV